MILKGIKEYNKDNFQIALEKDSAKLLYLLGKIKKVKNALEIGTGIGYSTIHLSLSCKKVVSIDKDTRNLEIARKLINKNNLKNIEFLLYRPYSLMIDSYSEIMATGKFFLKAESKNFN